jgi:hypothetical protein
MTEEESEYYRALTFREAEHIYWQAKRKLIEIGREIGKRRFEAIMFNKPEQYGDLTRQIPERWAKRPDRWKGIA